MIKVVILAGEGESYRILYNKIRPLCEVKAVFLEQENNQVRILKKRLKRIGIIKLIGQLIFKIVIQPILYKKASKRSAEIKLEYNLDSNKVDEAILHQIDSVNKFNFSSFLANTPVDIVILSGTRILSATTINQINRPILNLHAGITPAYRGVHGGYWALVDQKPEKCGVTLHFVDSGIDTGEVIAQSVIKPNEEDNFTTYPLLQLGKGLELLANYINGSREQKRIRLQSHGQSKLWSHPTAWEYLSNRIIKKIR